MTSVQVKKQQQDDCVISECRRYGDLDSISVLLRVLYVSFVFSLLLSEAIRRLKQYLPGLFQGRSTVHPGGASSSACCSDDSWSQHGTHSQNIWAAAFLQT